MEREVRLHINLHHDNIIHLYAAFEDEKHVYMVQVGSGAHRGPQGDRQYPLSGPARNGVATHGLTLLNACSVLREELGS